MKNGPAVMAFGKKVVAIDRIGYPAAKNVASVGASNLVEARHQGYLALRRHHRVSCYGANISQSVSSTAFAVSTSSLPSRLISRDLSTARI